VGFSNSNFLITIQIFSNSNFLKLKKIFQILQDAKEVFKSEVQIR